MNVTPSDAAGTTAIEPDQPEPANPTPEVEVPTVTQGMQKTNRPSAEELLRRVWEIRNAGGKPYPVLTQEYNVSSSLLSQWISAARLEVGLPRIEECIKCHDTRIVGGA